MNLKMVYFLHDFWQVKTGGILGKYIMALWISMSIAIPSFADQAYIRKIVDPETKSMLFLGCKNQHQCRVLGGGSISEAEALKMQRHLQLQFDAERFGIVLAGTAAMALNPVAVMGFLSVPAGVIGFVVSGGVVLWAQDDFYSKQQLKLLDTELQDVASSEKVFDLLDRKLKQFRSETSDLEYRRLR